MNTGRFVASHGEAACVARGQRATVEYQAWSSMVSRCYYPSNVMYGYYGARGILVCAEWRHDYPAFLASVGRRPTARHSLDRIDNSKGYSPENVRWATPSEQQQNRRSTHWVAVNGENICVAELSRRTGLPRRTITDRIERGWSIDRAISEPPGWRYQRKTR